MDGRCPPASVNNPTAMTLSRIISHSVITKAKPAERGHWIGGFMVMKTLFDIEFFLDFLQ